MIPLRAGPEPMTYVWRPSMSEHPRILVGIPSDSAENNCASPDGGLTLLPPILVGIPSDPTENNCASPDGGLTLLPSPIRNASYWQVASDLYRDELPDDHELVFNPIGGSNVLVLNAPARAVLDSFR